MENERATIRDIAKKLNVTASTVSRALQDHPHISSKMKKSVRAVARNLNYQPNGMAAALRNGRSKIIGIIIPNVDRSFFSSVVFGIEEIATKAGYNVMICQSHEDHLKEVASVEVLLNARVDGVIASPAKDMVDDRHFKKIKERGIPLILFDRANYNLEVSHVVVDDFLGAFNAVEHLIQQGSSKIAHFTGFGSASIFKERLRGYKEALLKNNLPFDSALVFESDLQLEDGKAIMNSIVHTGTAIDGIFSSSALGAMGALQVCKQNRISVPNQIAIVGFSNELFTSFCDPAISSVEQPSMLMGTIAAEMIFDQLKREKEDQLITSKKIVLNPKLIVRNSSMRRQLTE